MKLPKRKGIARKFKLFHGKWKIVTSNRDIPVELHKELRNKINVVDHEISLDCKVTRLVSPSGSFWEGEEAITKMLACLRKVV
ncbi:MAG: hypothetical protein Q8Q95_02480 [bacterium]|nr:hypothetical protein [bacterium]